MKKTLATLVFSMMVLGAWLVTPEQQQVVGAQGCTVSGKQMSASDGTLLCDCTVRGTSCNCIITCPPKGDGDVPAEQVEVS